MRLKRRKKYSILFAEILFIDRNTLLYTDNF